MRTEEKVIGGFKYRMEQVGMDEGDQIILRLARPVAALFSRVAKSGREHVTLEELVLTGAEPMLAVLTGKDVRFLRRKLAAKTVVFVPDGKVTREWPLPDVYNEHFAGRYDDWALWLLWGVQMNRFFGGALDRLDAMLAARKAKIAKAKTEAESRSTSPPEAGTAGGSGASSSASATARA